MGSKQPSKEPNWKHIQKTSSSMRRFKKAVVVTLAIKITLCLLMIAPTLPNLDEYKHNGAGTVVAFFYFSPVIIMDAAISLYFLYTSITLIRFRDNETIKLQYRPCWIWFLASILFTIVSFLPWFS